MGQANRIVHAVMQLPCGMHQRHLPIVEAERMMQRGECRRIHQAGKKSIGKTRPVYRMIEQVKPSESDWMRASITLGDMLAYSGLASREKVETARTKVREYARVYQHDPEFRSTA